LYSVTLSWGLIDKTLWDALAQRGGGHRRQTFQNGALSPADLLGVHDIARYATYATAPTTTTMAATQMNIQGSNLRSLIGSWSFGRRRQAGSDEVE
jgi:hypothetical protein